jgi:hypothetical protein
MQTTKQTKPAGFPRYAAAKHGLCGSAAEGLRSDMPQALASRKGTDDLNGTNGTREVL